MGPALRRWLVEEGLPAPLSRPQRRSSELASPGASEIQVVAVDSPSKSYLFICSIHLFVVVAFLLLFLGRGGQMIPSTATPCNRYVAGRPCLPLLAIVFELFLTP